MILAAGFFHVRDRQLVQRIGNRLQMLPGQVKILGSGLEISVAEQDLDRSQVGARFQ